MSVSESVLKIAAHSFGEDNVELIEDNTCVLIRAGDVEISNEEGLTHMLKSVWVKVHINTANFYICRSVLTQNEFDHNYCHSHRSRGTHPGEFNICCLGSGPIISTISTLSIDSSREDLWVVYFMQLKEYLATESLAGGPYYKIYDLRRPPYRGNTPSFDKPIFHGHKRIIHRLISNTIPRVMNNPKTRVVIQNNYNSYVNLKVKCHRRDCVTLKILSDELLKTANELEWDSSELAILSGYIMSNVRFTDNWTFTTHGNLTNSLSTSSDGAMFYFKGEPIKFIVEGSEDESSSELEFHLFYQSVINLLINTMISTAKAYFKNKKENRKWLILS